MARWLFFLSTKAKYGQCENVFSFLDLKSLFEIWNLYVFRWDQEFKKTSDKILSLKINFKLAIRRMVEYPDHLPPPPKK